MVEETPSTFIVRTANHLVVDLIYFDNEPRRRSFDLTKDEARRVAANIAKLPNLLSPRLVKSGHCVAWTLLHERSSLAALGP
jgi:hypothetical protein